MVQQLQKDAVITCAWSIFNIAVLLWLKRWHVLDQIASDRSQVQVSQYCSDASMTSGNVAINPVELPLPLIDCFSGDDY